MYNNPVRLFGIKNKGSIQVGYDADLSVIDLNTQYEIKNQNMHSKCGWTPYEGWQTQGSVAGTLIQGVPVYWQGEFTLDQPTGKPLEFL